MKSETIKVGKAKLLDELWHCQIERGYISSSDVRSIAKKLSISRIEVQGVVSFYHFFHRKPTGHYTIYLNDSIISELNGFDAVKEAFEKETGAKMGEVDATGTFGLYSTSCIGLSDQEPAALINFRPFVDLTPKKVRKIIAALKERQDIDQLADKVVDHIKYDLGEKSVFIKEYRRGEIVKQSLKMPPEDIIEDIKWSGLSGRGGAFFPTGLKWDICRKAFSNQKYIICNADEGEPGTFKDRYLLNEYVGLILEGMIIAGYAVGASIGFIYLRAEYMYLKDRIEKEIQEFHNSGYLGENILGCNGFDFEIIVQLGAGAYVCGEETALIESLEGKRGEPRTKTFFPVKRGYLYKPTVVNNVETYCAAARIMEIGAPAFKELGTAESTGSKLLSVSGDCEKPGIYEIEWGMTIRELLRLCYASDTRFIQFSGPSGTLLSEKDFDRKICYEDLICGGSIMIFNSTREIWKVLVNFSNFFINESCGLCTPCRAGNFQIGKKIEKIKKGKGRREDLDDIKKWAEIVKKTSRCGLGKTSNNFVLDMFEKFPDELSSLIPAGEDSTDQGFNLEESLVDYSDFVMKTNKDG